MSAAAVVSSRPGRGAALCLELMRWALGFYILFFPLGISFREIGAVGAMTGLVGYYVLDWRGSSLRRFPLRWVLAAFFALLIFKGLHSICPAASWYALSHNSYKGPFLLLAGLEVVRRPGDLRFLAWAFVIMTLYTGLDGIYQWCTGFDFFFSMPWSGRVNAMWETGRIGNLMALTVPVTLALPALLPARWPLAARLAVAAVLAFPGLFLLVGAQARSGWFGFLLAMSALAWAHLGARRAVLAPLLVMVALGGLALAFPRLMSADALLGSPRFIIWDVALDVWRHWPILGAGVGCFEAGYEALGIQFDLGIFGEPVPHPHNIYAQFLAETGIVGTAILLALLLGNLVWAGRRMRARILAARGAGRELSGHDATGACLWAAQAGYLLTAFSAHDFYRTWWLGMSMLVTGLALGAALARWRDGDGA